VSSLQLTGCVGEFVAVAIWQHQGVAIEMSVEFCGAFGGGDGQRGVFLLELERDIAGAPVAREIRLAGVGVNGTAETQHNDSHALIVIRRLSWGNGA
jgi:hypothetical protein